MHSPVNNSRKRPAQDFVMERVVSSSGCASSKTGEFEITSTDVLLGRGKRIMNNPGNIKFKKLVEGYKDGYDKLEKVEKTRLSREIVYSVRRDGGRFLAMNPHSGMYEDAGDYIAREKVSHILREKPRQKRSKKPINKRKDKSSRRHSNIELIGQGVLETLLNKQRKIFDELNTSSSNSVSVTLEDSPEEEVVEECLSSKFFFNLEGVAEDILYEEDTDSFYCDDSMEPSTAV
mmetsp:Transcript_11341/g.17549  ORF Transcript_11341/g.17549 Transcript_11341/m.17549 type:complete len:233 (-) Transcript_11341:35-733(-)|eukprot:CAMPEP_0195286254 /NCGR_PEP_ID=MMETSP0707-20130614/3778_1 /TAXON_ID=33640 /ORGANISM="Asterionellopsis glacialis, Strain CCMP134" /LENGTH=232 /DNA_ID=CAMNT_0040345865 /DNA_START=67 /DNA_END=765 /DNA_ORIENTATION=-